MNIRGIKKTIIVACTAFASVSLLMGIGSATYYFANEINETVNANPIGDAIRPNQTFGEEDDMVISNNNRYDVYFLGQGFNVYDKLINNGDGTYSFNPSQKLVYSNNAYHGKWPHSDFWPNENASNVGYYYNNCYIGPRVYRNVSEITNGMLTDLGNPDVLGTDSNGNVVANNSLIDKAEWQIYFSGWSLNWDKDMYAGGFGRQVTGSYPHDMELVRFNTVLDMYNDKAINIDGRLSLFFYPIYGSSGKDYYSYESKQYDSLRDSISITGSDKFNINRQFAPDATFTNEMHSKGMNDSNGNIYYRAYRYTNFLVNEENVSSVSPAQQISLDWDMYNGSWNDQRNTLDVTLNSQVGRYNIYLFVKERYDEDDSSLIGSTSTQPASYADFTSEEKNKIDTILNESGIYSYKKYSFQSIKKTVKEANVWRFEYSDYRGFYLIIERVYEPRVIGGSSLSLDYNHPISYRLNFTRQGSSGVDLNSYELRNRTVNVSKDPNGSGVDYIYYQYRDANGIPVRDYYIPSYYFAIQVALDQNTIYEQKLFGNNTSSDPDNPSVPDYEFVPTGYKVPEFKFKDGNGNVQVEKYSSMKYLISMQDMMDLKSKTDLTSLEKEWLMDLDRIKTRTYVGGQPNELHTLRNATQAEWDAIYNNVHLIRFKITGTYNVYTRIHYDANYLPEYVDLWTYRLHNIFVNIYDPADFGGETIKVGSTYLDENIYSYRCKDYYYLSTPIQSGDTYIRPNTLPPGSLLDEDGYVTFDAILNHYDSLGKCLQDVISGRYITIDNFATNPFIVQKNYILQVVDNPY